jgi:hypothetical protein
MPWREGHTISASVCEELMAIGLRALARQRTTRDGWRLSQAFWEELDALDATAISYRLSKAADLARDLASCGEPEPAMSHTADVSLVTIKRAAEIAGVTVSALSERCRRGTLPYTRDARGWRVVNVENL